MSWFHSSGAKPGGGGERLDRYFHERGNSQLGIKIRDETRAVHTVEIKGLVAFMPANWLSKTQGVELWCKWKSQIVMPSGGLLTAKRRWLRKFDAAGPIVEIGLDHEENPVSSNERPLVGCNIELTRVEIGGGTDVWWTLGYESFGDLNCVATTLQRVFVAVRTPMLIGGLQLSYPAWLERVLDPQ